MGSMIEIRFSAPHRPYRSKGNVYEKLIRIGEKAAESKIKTIHKILNYPLRKKVIQWPQKPMTNLKKEVLGPSVLIPLKNTLSGGHSDDPIELKTNWEVLGVGYWGLV